MHSGRLSIRGVESLISSSKFLVKIKVFLQLTMCNEVQDRFHTAKHFYVLYRTPSNVVHNLKYCHNSHFMVILRVFPKVIIIQSSFLFHNFLLALAYLYVAIDTLCRQSRRRVAEMKFLISSQNQGWKLFMSNSNPIRR